MQQPDNAGDLGQIKILVVDDDPLQCKFYSALLMSRGYSVDTASSLAILDQKLSSANFDAVLLDLQLGDEDGLDGLHRILTVAPSVRVYILTAYGSVFRAVEAMRKGASGFFEKGADSKVLLSELEDELSGQKVNTSRSIDLEKMGLIGSSKALRTVVDKISRLFHVDSTILLLGESGTGKEVIARTIHRTSQRARQRFAAINCGAIPGNLLESELFGHRRGAFTDAKTDRKGVFELTSSGTLLLDEIGDMPLDLQTKLLRVLQEREITPLGSSESIKIDTRIIASTHHDIAKEAAENRFREDLYYRLSIVVLRIPPLRERADDIPQLVEHFIGIFNERFSRQMQLPTSSQMARLQAYHWPGNIRELQNSIERAVVLAPDDSFDMEDVFPQADVSFGHSVASNDRHLPQSETDHEFLELPLTNAKSAFERYYLEHHVKQCHGNVNSLAEKSGRYRADIYRLLNRHGIEHSNFKD